MLVLRRGTVLHADPPEGTQQAFTVEIDGRERRAFGDVALHGETAAGDDVVVNTQAVDLALGSGGADVLHVNLTRGLGRSGVPGAHVMKLNYTSLQHAVLPVEGEDLHVPLGRPAAVFGLHGQLAPIAWAFSRTAPGGRLGYVQTAGGALPGGHSRVVARMLDEGLLAGHLTAAPAFGGQGEAITTAGALQHGLHDLGWDAAVVGPGPGILGSGSALGHGGLIALDSAHTGLALGCRVVLCARMSSGDPRPRHQGLSHHTATVLRLLLAPVEVALPVGPARTPDADGVLPVARVTGLGHTVTELETDLDGYRASGLPARTMGRSIDEDAPFFAAALACGAALAARITP
ncbi:DUF3866 family protein [Conexibacter sp. W3-3-2]|uniref:DUF3866 family protein n=1 Tax=Conexibacter sp. W3-3-2 TaxID=2675227 RepID=UPI0012B6F81B|nr:DUF3866 family protein [Conexibacter sp. W3-3-2]MTD43017.1 DUF3866 family protein [Conexibacter sp. W3-3-2]